MLGQGAEAEGPLCEASGGLGTSQLDLEGSPRVDPVPALQLLRAEIIERHTGCPRSTAGWVGSECRVGVKEAALKDH